MAQQSLGTRLVESFKLLLEYKPSKQCSQYVDEQMLLRPDKRVFQTIMSYILFFIDSNWKSTMPSVVLTKQDERLFYNGLCGHLKTLRKDFPEVGLPLLSPSSLVCFHGEKCQEILLKITNALMLKIMRKEKFDVDNEVVESNLSEFENLCSDNSKLRTELESIDHNNANVLSQRVNILKLIVDNGNWDEKLKMKLMDFHDKSAVSDVRCENVKLLQEVNALKGDLQLCLKHITHEISEETCECEVSSALSFTDISKLLWESTVRSTEAHVRNLKCASTIRRLRLADNSNELCNLNLVDAKTSELIEKLESKMYELGGNQEMSKCLLLDSPLILKPASPFGGNDSFSPVVASDWLNLKKDATVINVESFNQLINPVKVNVSPIDPSNYHVIARMPWKQPVSNESVSSILQRMRSKATPRKFGKQKIHSVNDIRMSSSSISSSMLSKASLSASKDFRNNENFTPFSKNPAPLASQSTNRRQSIGFVKPSVRKWNYVRKQLNPPSVPEKKLSTCSFVEEGRSLKQNFADNCRNLGVQKPEDVNNLCNNVVVLSPLNTPSSKGLERNNKLYSTSKEELLEKHIPVCDGIMKEKSFKSENLYSDKTLDMITKKIIEEESSFSSEVSDFSLSGVEILPSSPKTEMKLLDSENGRELQDTTVNMSPPKATDVSSVLAEMMEEDKNINLTLKSIIDGETSKEYCSSDSSQSVLDPVNISKSEVSKKSIPQHLSIPRKKSGRDSLGLLIERFKAIKNNYSEN